MQTNRKPLPFLTSCAYLRGDRAAHIKAILEEEIHFHSRRTEHVIDGLGLSKKKKRTLDVRGTARRGELRGETAAINFLHRLEINTPAKAGKELQAKTRRCKIGSLGHPCHTANLIARV